MFGAVVMTGTLHIQQCYDWDMVWLGCLMLLLGCMWGSAGINVMFGTDGMIWTLNLPQCYDWEWYDWDSRCYDWDDGHILGMLLLLGDIPILTYPNHNSFTCQLDHPNHNIWNNFTCMGQTW